MKKLTKYLLFFTIALIVTSFKNGTIPTKKDNEAIKVGSYVYLRVQHMQNYPDPTISFFSNVFWVDGAGSTFVKNLDKKKERFQEVLRNEYDLEWPLSQIIDYEQSDYELLVDDRKTRISQAGYKDVRYINL